MTKTWQVGGEKKEKLRKYNIMELGAGGRLTDGAVGKCYERTVVVVLF